MNFKYQKSSQRKPTTIHHCHLDPRTIVRLLNPEPRKEVDETSSDSTKVTYMK